MADHFAAATVGSPVTVFGATGFIGSRLVARLRQLGHDVYCPSRTILADGTLRRQLGHAFYCIGSDNWRDPQELTSANFLHFKTALESCDFTSMVYLSSSRVYLGADEGREGVPLTILPDDPGRLYNVTKISAEAYAQARADSRIKIVRPSNVIGYTPNSAFLIPTLIRHAVDQGVISFSIGPDSSKDYVAVETLIEFLLRLATADEGGIYNFGGRRNTRLSHIAETIHNHTGCRVEWLGDGKNLRFPPISMAHTDACFGVQDSAFDLLGALPSLIQRYQNGEPAACSEGTR